MVETSPSNAGGAGSIPGQGARIPHALWPKNQNIKQSSIVTNSVKTLKMVHIKKKKNQKKKSNLPNKDFEVMIIKMLNELGRRMHDHSEKFNKRVGKYNEEPNRTVYIVTDIKKYTRRSQQ